MPETAKAISGVGCAKAGACTGGPQLGLQLRRLGIDLRKLLLITGGIEQDTLIQVVEKQRPHFRRIGGRQQAGPRVFCADSVGLLFLVVLTLIVAAQSHRKVNPTMSASRVSVAARIMPKSSRTAASTPRFLENNTPIHAESARPKKVSPKTSTG